MHELGIAKDLFDVILTKTTKKILKITVKVGAGSGIDKDFLRHSFADHLFPGTIAEKAELVLVTEPVKLACRHCGSDIDEDSYDTGKENHQSLVCRRCKGTMFDISSGMNTYVESIETEE
jgi:hydrogenase nickel insertion protein HypA